MAELKRVGLVFNADGTANFTKSLSQVNSATRQSYQELKQAQLQYDKNTTSTQKLTDRQKYLQTATESYSDKVAMLSMKLEEQENAEVRDESAIAKTKAQLAQAETQQAQYEKALKEVNLTLDSGADKFYDYGDKIQETSKTMKNVGKTATKYVTTPIVGIGTAAVSTASDFDSAMSQVAATMGVTVDDVQELSDVAREMGSTTNFSATEAAEGLNILAMSGLNASQQIETLPNVLNLAGAGALSLDDAASYLTTTIKGFGDTTANAQKYVDLMAKGATLANTDVSGLGEALSGVSANARGYGQSVDTMTLQLLKLAEGGMTGSEASTALSRAMADLYTPTANASKAMKELGVEAYDPTTHEARDMEDVIRDLNVALQDYDEETQNAYKDSIFTTNGLKAYNKIANVSDETTASFAEALANASDDFDGAGAAAQQYAVQQDNLAGDTDILKSALSEAGIAIGEQLMPFVREIVQAVTGWIDKFNGLSDTAKTVITVIGGVAAAIGPLLLIVGELGTGIGKGVNQLGDFAKKFYSASGGTTTLTSAISGMSAPMMAVIAVIALVVAAVVDLWKNNEEFRDNVTNMIDNIMSIFDSMWQAIKPIFDTIAKTVTNIWNNSLKPLWNKFEDMIASIVSAMNEFSNVVTPIINAVIKLLGKTLQPVVEAIGGVFETAFAVVSAVLGTAIDTVSGFVSGVSGFFGDVQKTTEKVWNSVSDTIGSVWSAISSTVSTVIGAISSTITNIWNGIKSTTTTVWNAVKTAVTTPINAVKTTVSNIVSAIKTTVTNIWNAIKSTTTTVWDAVKTAISTPINAVKTTVSNVVSAIRTTVSNVWNSIKSTTSSLWNSIKTAVTTPINAVKTTVSNVIGSIKTTVSNIWNSIKSTTSSVWNGVLSAIKTPMNTAKSFVQGIINSIKGFFNFTFKWPKIPMPHFSISPSGWKIGDLLKGSIPSLGISWYAKAMDEGAILNGATIFGYANGQLLGAGEAGSETVVGTQSLMDMISSASNEGNAEIVDAINRLANVLSDDERWENIFARAIEDSGFEMTVDGRTFGRLVRKYD